MRSRLSEMWTTPAGRGFIMLATMSVCYGFALNAHMGLVTNFFEEVLHLDGPQFGYMTAIREVGGFLLIFLTAVLYRISLQKVTAGALVMLGVGYIFYGYATDFWNVIPWVVITSLGFHTVLQTQNALSMSLTTESRSGSILGKMAAFGQVGTFAALIMVFVIFYFDLMSYQTTFIILGVVALIGAAAIVRFPHLHDGELRKVAPKREPLVFKKDYRYYYVLNILDGARQQIFFSFGLWVLVNRFGLDVAHISILLLSVAVVSMVSSPWIGRTVDKRGESGTLSVVNVAYVVALVGFALAGQVLVACFFYLIYVFISPFSYIATTTYLRKIATPEDVAPSLAMGVTLLHATAIVVPVAAGFILNYVGYQVPFLIACIFAIAAIPVTRRLNPREQRSPAKKALDEAAEAGGLAPVGEAALAAANDSAEATAILMAGDGGAGEEIAAQGALGAWLSEHEKEPPERPQRPR